MAFTLSGEDFAGFCTILKTHSNILQSSAKKTCCQLPFLCGQSIDLLKRDEMNMISRAHSNESSIFPPVGGRNPFSQAELVDVPKV